MSNHIPAMEESISRFNASDIDGPIHMLNPIKFKADGSAEALKKYSRSVFPMVKKVGGDRVYYAEGRCSVVGSENWNVVLIMQYPSVAAFHEMISTEEYLSLTELREEVVEDFRLHCIQAP